MGNGQQLHANPTNGGREIGLGQLPKQSSSNGDHPPPGFSSTKSTVNGIMMPSFASKSASQLVVGAQRGVASRR